MQVFKATESTVFNTAKQCTSLFCQRCNFVYQEFIDLKTLKNTWFLLWGKKETDWECSSLGLSVFQSFRLHWAATTRNPPHCIQSCMPFAGTAWLHYSGCASRACNALWEAPAVEGAVTVSRNHGHISTCLLSAAG